MRKTSWKKWLFIIGLLLGTNAVSWNRERIAKVFEVQKPGGAVNVGVLIDDQALSGDQDQDIALAQSYLSQNHHWLCVKCAKVPLPMSPFTEGTGFHFQPVSEIQKMKFPPLAFR